MHSHYAIIIGLDCMTGLQTARILTNRNVPVLAFAKDPNHFSCRTKSCKKIFFANTENEEFIFRLMNLGPKLKQKAVLYPCTDMSVLQISKNQSKLAKWYIIDLPEEKTLHMLMNKLEFFKFSQRENLSIPPTYLLHNKEDAYHTAKKLNYPCILKPPFRTPEWEKTMKVKVVKVFNEEEFIRVHKKSIDLTDVL